MFYWQMSKRKRKQYGALNSFWPTQKKLNSTHLTDVCNAKQRVDDINTFLER